MAQKFVKKQKDTLSSKAQIDSKLSLKIDDIVEQELDEDSIRLLSSENNIRRRQNIIKRLKSLLNSKTFHLDKKGKLIIFEALCGLKDYPEQLSNSILDQEFVLEL